jgi:hypothetical protein
MEQEQGGVKPILIQGASAALLPIGELKREGFAINFVYLVKHGYLLSVSVSEIRKKR